MGISDEDYADAIIKQKAYEVEQMKEQVKMSGLMNSLGNIIGAGTSTGLSNNPYYAQQQATNTAVQMPYGHFKVLAEQDLHHEAMKAPLSALVDMWLARWQGEWVSETNFQEDDFWRITLVRLTGANKLEKHNLATQMSPVYRIIE